MAIEFFTITSFEPVVARLTMLISYNLSAGSKVLWLIPGGSGIEIAVDVASKLQKHDKLDNLTVTLTDERYGPVGHPDSNWQQLVDASFKIDRARLQPVLEDVDLPTTANHYDKLIDTDIKLADYKLGFIGIGADGHVAGIKPHCLAINSNKMAVGYRADDYERLTVTPKAIAKLDEVVCYVSGPDKWPVIDTLGSLRKTISELPAECLKAVRKVTIYNDRKGATL